MLTSPPRLRPVACARRLLSLAVLIAAAPLAAGQEIAFGAVLDGAFVVPPSGSSGGGTLSAVMDLDANTLTIDLTYAGLAGAETTADIHGFAPAGANAPAIFSLPLGFNKQVVWNYAQADEADILADKVYVQIASSTFPGGELRGQLQRDSSLYSMTAPLDGSQAVPPAVTPAKGSAHVSIDPVQNKLSFILTFEGITSAQTAAHIHGPADPGQTNGVVFALPINAGNVVSAVWDYTEAEEAGILAGKYYFNVHSNLHPTGEVRGQIVPLATNPTTYCTAKTTSLGCAPALTSIGNPSVSGTSNFIILSGPVPGNNLGIFFYGKSGPATIPFQGSFLCVQPPTLRTPATSSGGTTGVCDGAYVIDFTAYIASGVDPLLVPGTLVNIQTWFRDPPEPISGTGLSDGMMFGIRL